MTRRLPPLLLILAALAVTHPARGADEPDLTPLHPPTPVPTLPPVMGPGGPFVPLGFYRPSRWDVWQYYAVDRTGHFRPRVALTPDSTFYLYNGKPYYLLPVQPRWMMPYMLD